MKFIRKTILPLLIIVTIFYAPINAFAMSSNNLESDIYTPEVQLNINEIESFTDSKVVSFNESKINQNKTITTYSLADGTEAEETIYIHPEKKGAKSSISGNTTVTKSLKHDDLTIRLRATFSFDGKTVKMSNSSAVATTRTPKNYKLEKTVKREGQKHAVTSSAYIKCTATANMIVGYNKLKKSLKLSCTPKGVIK